MKPPAVPGSPQPDEQALIQCINDAVQPVRYRRHEPRRRLERVRLLATWKGLPFALSRGIALAAIDHYADHPADFAHKLRIRTGKLIGYVPLVYPLGLHFIVCGRRILSRA